LKTIKKLSYILSSSEKKKVIYLFFLTFFTSILDVVGLTSIFPFILILSNPNLIETNVILFKLYNVAIFFGIKNVKQFIFSFGLISLFLLITSLFFRALKSHFIMRFALMSENSISSRLLKLYLFQSYSWFLKRNTASLRKNILSEINQLIHGIIIPLANIFSSIILMISLLIIIILINPKFAINIALVLGISYSIIFFSVKKKLSKIGSENAEVNTERFKSINEIFGSLKEIKIRGLEEICINRFDKASYIYARNQSVVNSISELPRYFLEAVAFGSMIILMLLFLYQEKSFSEIIPTISFYAICGYRLMPTMQQLYSAYSKIRFSSFTLNFLYESILELRSSRKDLAYESNSQPILLNKSLDLKNIHFSYPGTDIPVLKNINITIPAYSKIGIVGKTGSGKSTLVDIILNLLDNYNGTVSADGKNITSANKRVWQSVIGYVPQQIYLYDTSIACNIASGVDEKLINKELLIKVAKIANLHDFIKNELPEGYDTNVGEKGLRLSGGQRQRIGIARALYHKPKLIIFDEATNSLDNITEKAVMDALNKLENKSTIIIIAHRFSAIKDCDLILILEKGEIIAKGSYDELKNSNKFFNNMLSSKNKKNENNFN
jgi:ABC-type multidrug transport system fused ATPase/permease subunit